MSNCRKLARRYHPVTVELRDGRQVEVDLGTVRGHAWLCAHCGTFDPPCPHQEGVCTDRLRESARSAPGAVLVM